MTGQHGRVKWKARLQGHSFDLEMLAETFSEGDPKVSLEGDGNYVLECSAFDPFTEQ
ncbi:MAG: hypothetical protein LC808_15695 [Actinobacteria bacterium]|nr:hypothetical protein [Actinomycetota bacterium]